MFVGQIITISALSSLRPVLSCSDFSFCQHVFTNCRESSVLTCSFTSRTRQGQEVFYLERGGFESSDKIMKWSLLQVLTPVENRKLTQAVSWLPSQWFLQFYLPFTLTKKGSHICILSIDTVPNYFLLEKGICSLMGHIVNCPFESKVKLSSSFLLLCNVPYYLCIKEIENLQMIQQKHGEGDLILFLKGTRLALSPLQDYCTWSDVKTCHYRLTPGKCKHAFTGFVPGLMVVPLGEQSACITLNCLILLLYIIYVRYRMWPRLKETGWNFCHFHAQNLSWLPKLTFDLILSKCVLGIMDVIIFRKTEKDRVNVNQELSDPRWSSTRRACSIWTTDRR